MTRMEPDTLARLARACPQDGPPSAPSPRDFCTWEVTQFMLPMAAGHFRRVLRDTPALPGGGPASGTATRRFPLEDLARLRAHFATRGRAVPAPALPSPAPVVVCAGAAGTGRSHLALHLAVAGLLRDGLRVLALDLDGTGTLTRALGATAKAPGPMAVLARHHGAYLQSQNRARLGRGERPLPLDAELARALELDFADLLRPTRWPGLALLPAAPGLGLADPQIAQWRMDAPGWPLWSALADRLDRDGMRARHDLVVIDAPAGLGQVGLAALGAADLVLVPCPPDPEARAATAAWLETAADSLRAITARATAMARALGGTPPPPGGAALRLVATRHDDRRDAVRAAAMQAAFGPALLPHRLPETALIGPGRRCFYDIDPREPGRAAYVPLRLGFDAVYDDVKQVLTGLGQQSAATAPAAPGDAL